RHQQRERYTALRDVMTKGVKRMFNRGIVQPFKRLANSTTQQFNDLTSASLSNSTISHFNNSTEEFYALRDVSFEIKQGERVGIIGRNGAGKTTLLKLLSRITEPTTGRITLKGRVASLLEVGTGFHPELTGRENIFLNGAILGMSKVEIKKKFDEIVDFAEIEKFLDTPVKRYSSGMYVRLAFAVAAHLEPEILLVDEVLAVGDAQFQKKCLGKMEEVSEKEGRTVLFVSHNMSAIEHLTQKSLLLKQGKIDCFGETADIIGHFLNALSADYRGHYYVESLPRRVIGNQTARFIELSFSKETAIFDFRESIRFIARVRANEILTNIRFSITIYSVSGFPIGSCFGPPFYSMQPDEVGVFEVSVPNPRLAPGSYCCGVAIGKGDNTTGYVNFDVVHDVLYFDVRPEEGIDGTVASWLQSWGSVSFESLEQVPVVK
ncbi:MAG: ABC transporter ATP-binding protein, partial [Nitrospira sp.]|nr:ABC transporter ATP-binding protein [Nitrospira sp.]